MLIHSSAYSKEDTRHRAGLALTEEQFLNKRTQMKAQVERHENLLLKQENSKLRIENMAVKESLRNLICSKCGGEQCMRQLKEELSRVNQAGPE